MNNSNQVKVNKISEQERFATEQSKTSDKLIEPNESGALGGFQLEFVGISRVINHMTCYDSSALIGGKFI